VKYDFQTLIDRSPARRGTGKYQIMFDSKGNPPPPGTIPLSVADMEFRTAPCIIDALREEVEYGLWGYHMITPSFREACCQWMQTRHGWQVEPEWLVPVEQVVPALYISLFAFTQPGDGVIVQMPAYYHFADAARNTGRRVLENRLVPDEKGRYTIDFADLERKAAQARLLFLCSPHNPTGRVFTPEELRHIGDICLRHKVLVVADEIHHDLIMPGHTHTVLASLGREYAENCVTCTSLSKTFNLAGLCYATIIISNPALRQQFMTTMSTHGFKHTSRLGPVAQEAAYRRGAEWLDELIQVVFGNFCYFRDFMARHFPQVVVTELEGTYLAWFNCECFSMTDDEMRDFLTDECRLYLDNGPQFGSGGSGWQRINLACPQSVLADALERFRAGMEARESAKG